MIKLSDAPHAVFDGAVPATIANVRHLHSGALRPWAMGPGNTVEITLSVGYGEDTETYTDEVVVTDCTPVQAVKRDIWASILGRAFPEINELDSLDLHVVIQDKRIIAIAPKPDLLYFPAGAPGPVHEDFESQ